MNFSKKNHHLVGQNEEKVTPSKKHDANLQKNSTLYFQVGLIMTLLVTYALFEMQFPINQISFDAPTNDEPNQIYVNYVPEPMPEPVKEIVKPVKKKVLAMSFKPVKNDVQITDVPKDIITEPVSDPGPIDPGDIVVEKKPSDIDNKVYTVVGVEQVPIYPGCEGLSSNKQRLDCMSGKLKKLVSRKFDVDLIDDLGISTKQRIYVNFKIDKSGNIQDIRARNPHSKLEKEAIKVANKIPQMTPAKQSNKNVEVMYTLPITIQVQN